MRGVWFGSQIIWRLSSLLGRVGFPGDAPGLGAALTGGGRAPHCSVPRPEELGTAQGSLPCSLTGLPMLL